MYWIDPDHLPGTSGVPGRFMLNGEGEAGGLVLTNGRQAGQHRPYPLMGTGTFRVNITC